MLHVSRPAATTVTAYVALLGRWAVAARVHDRGPMSPGLPRLAVVF